MNFIYADIELINPFATGTDSLLVPKHLTVKMAVNTGVWMTGITEEMQAQLQLLAHAKRSVRMPDGTIEEFSVVGPINFRFDNRTAAGNALVLPADSQPVLGMIAIAEMDVLIDKDQGCMIVNPTHPDGAVLRL